MIFPLVAAKFRNPAESVPRKERTTLPVPLEDACFPVGAGGRENQAGRQECRSATLYPAVPDNFPKTDNYSFSYVLHEVAPAVGVLGLRSGHEVTPAVGVLGLAGLDGGDAAVKRC